MKALALLLLLPSLALAQGVVNSPGPASATSSGVVTTGTQTIAGTKTFTGPIVFGEAISASNMIYMNLGRIATGFAFLHNSYEGSLTDAEYIVGTHPAVHVFSDSSIQTTAGHKLMSVWNGPTVAAEKFTIDKDGAILASGGNGAGNPVPVVHNAQTTAAQAMEFGKTAATGGALAVTFATAFASAPVCTCTGTNATPAGCVISTAANTTAVTFTFGAGTDVINWICIGAK